MLIPDFVLNMKNKYTKSEISNKRYLEEFSHLYDEINVVRDVVDFKFIMKSDEDPNKIQYFLSI